MMLINPAVTMIPNVLSTAMIAAFFLIPYFMYYFENCTNKNFKKIENKYTIDCALQGIDAIHLVEKSIKKIIGKKAK